MEKKRLIGAKIFGVIFILLAGSLIGPSLTEWMLNSPSNQYYLERASTENYHLYQVHISYLEDFQRKNSALAPSANQILFAKQFAQFKQEAESFRQNFIVHGRIPLHTQIFIYVGFATCLVYVIAGFGLILNFLWARELALWSLLLGFLFYLADLFNLYSLTIFTTALNKKDVALETLLAPSIIYGYTSSLLGYFRSFLLNPVVWLMTLPMVLYDVCVIYYFTRPKVKEQFKP